VAAETAAKVRAFIESEAVLAARSEAPLDERIEAIRLLAHAPFSLARGPLPGLVDAREDRAIQIESVRSLSAHRDAGVAALLLEGWTRSSPEVRREVLEALFGQEERIPPLLESIESGAIAARSIDAVNRKRLLEHRSEAVRERARGLFGDQGAGDRKSALEEYRSALDLKGDRGRGREAFRKACATCHQLEGEGHAVGPDLRVAQGRTPEGLLTQILDPNRELLPVYTTYLVLTRDGRSITGIIASETAAGLTLKRAEAVEETVLRSAILKVEDTGLSLMPEGLERDLRPQDLADLIAYLLSVR
jgi:putative heme-binding domain-containing protein